MSGEITNRSSKFNKSPRFSNKFTVIVKPNSKYTKYNGLDSSGRHLISLKERAVDNKANIGLIRFFKKEFGINIRIKSGLTNREKILETQ